MSFDLQFLSLVDDLIILSATEVENSSPRSVRLLCEGDVRYTKVVEVNGIETTNFSIASARSLIVTLDSTFDDTDISDLSFAAVSSRWTSGQKVRLKFTPTVTLTRVTGTQKLIQQLVKALLSGKGTNRFNRTEGGDILTALGKTLDPSAKTQIASIFSEGAAAVESMFIASQAGKKIPPSERLLSFSFTRVSFDETSMQAVAYLRVVTYSGKSVSVPLVI